MRGRWKSQHWKLCISLAYVETFNSKVIKGFVPELRSRYVFFEFWDSYVLWIYMLWTLYVRFTYAYLAMLHLCWEEIQFLLSFSFSSHFQIFLREISPVCRLKYPYSLFLVDKFTYLGSSVLSTEKDIDTRLTKVWTAIYRLSIIWKSDLTDKRKRSFFQAAVVSILLYGCTTWTLTKRLEKKLDRNYTRMLQAILNKSWQQHRTRNQLYGHENYPS